MEVTYLTAINQALHEEMRRDENVFVMGEDVAELGGAFKATDGLLDAFGEDRVIDTPISEALIVGAGIGAAILGMRPVVEMQFGDFISCAFDQIVNTAATLRYRHGGQAACPLVIRSPSGAGVHGALFHSQNPEAWFTRVPGLKVVAPATVYDAKGLLKSAIRDGNPVLYFEHKRLYRSIKEDLPEGEFTVPIGVAEVRQAGTDLSIITYGGTLSQCLDAVRIVEKEDGLSVEVLDLRTLLPLDREAILATARKTGKVLIVHEDRMTGGFGGEVAAIVAENAFDALDGPIRRLAAADTHLAFSPPMEEFILPNSNKIVEAIRSLASY
ncbi:MAG TPA: alpha-ketoacid dehydrogenase subunit beta [Candidatus Binataceae bacterium]|nr:alpha-ketoacid dehydrogenase subunit beta [Candidatus Binataceae bacterium]